MSDINKPLTIPQMQAATRNALERCAKLEERVARLEDEMVLCLKALRVMAETEAKKKDPNFKVHENVKA